jgi:hypothetical protein
MSSARRPDESFEDYKAHRSEENKDLKTHLQGTKFFEGTGINRKEIRNEVFRRKNYGKQTNRRESGSGQRTVKAAA